jgi:HAD superfamily hydrolase (TIGR01662 family)
VQERVVELLGPFDVVELCPHAPDAGCECRKPRPGMVLAACARLDVDPARCVVVGDIESDVLAAGAAGAAGWLVPNLATRTDEVSRATRSGVCAGDLQQVVDRVLAGAW